MGKWRFVIILQVYGGERQHSIKGAHVFRHIVSVINTETGYVEAEIAVHLNQTHLARLTYPVEV